MPSRRFAHVDAVRLAYSHARPLSLNHPSAYLEGRLRLFLLADRLRQSVKLRSIVLFKATITFSFLKEDCFGFRWSGQAAPVRITSFFSQQPQIPFCTKRKVVALFIYRRERVCPTHFLRPKAVGRVGFKSDLPIDDYHRQMVNRILSPTLPEYRPARWAQ